MSDGKQDDESFEINDEIQLVPYWNKEEQMRQAALSLAVKARTPNANADEIVREATTFETYLTGKTS